MVHFIDLGFSVGQAESILQQHTEDAEPHQKKEVSPMNVTKTLYAIAFGIALSTQVQAAIVCEAVSGLTGGREIKTGDSQLEACASALSDCNYKQSPDGRTCYIRRWYDQQTTAGGMMSGQGWACLVQENNTPLRGRSWVRPGKTIAEARDNAQKYCEVRKAGNNCQVVRCFDASSERPN